MSSILVDNLTGKTTAGSITVTSEGGAATLQLQQGLAKVWVNYDCASTTPRDSFNVASLTDNGVGHFTTNFTNDMNNDDYSIPTSSNNVNASGTLYSLDPHTYAAGSVGCDSFEVNTSTVGQIDNNHNHLAIFGDLA